VLNRQTDLPEPSFLYGSGGHLRAVWRISVFAFVYFVVYGILSGTVGGALSLASRETSGIITPTDWVDLITALAVTGFVLHAVDKQRWSDIGFTMQAWRPMLLLRSAALGGGVIGVTAGILALFGYLHFQPDTLSALMSGDSIDNSPTTAWMLSTLRITLVLIPAAMFEEVIFRGYLWRVTEDSTSPQIALVVTSIFFAIAHVQNPGADLLAIGNVMLAGVALGLLRMITNSLPAAWIAHFAWNWTMAAALHVPVSGLPMSTPGYRAVLDGPEWFAGGNWGPEGGFAATVVLLAVVCYGLFPAKFPGTSSNLPTNSKRGRDRNDATPTPAARSA
jgi:membrane protease YdiL (CAAX protease family)